MRINKIVRTLLLLFLCIHLPNVTLALSKDGKLPYRFRANSIAYDQKRHTTTYLGNAIITQGTTRISGDKIILRMERHNRIKQLIAYGLGHHLAHYSTLPDHKRKRLFAEAKQIHYYPNTHVVLLEHQGRVTQRDNIFTGAHLRYDIKHGSIITRPSPHQPRSLVVIEPQNK